MKNKFTKKHKNVLIINGTQGIASRSLAVVRGLHTVAQTALRAVCRPSFIYKSVDSNDLRNGSTPRARKLSRFGGRSTNISTLEIQAGSAPRARKLSLLGSQFMIALLLGGSVLPFAAGLLPSNSVTDRVPFAPEQAAAQQSNTLNFQGRLLNASGSLVDDGIYNMQFDLYYVSSGGTSQWTEDRLVTNTQGVTVTNGYFSVYLGEYDALPSLDWSEELWLGMTVRGTSNCAWGSCTPTDSEMTPRFQLTALPYAFVSSAVETADTNAVSTNTNDINISTGNAAGATSDSGDITIDVGTATGTVGSLLFGTANATTINVGSASTTTTMAGRVVLSGGGASPILQIQNDVSASEVSFTGDTTTNLTSQDTIVLRIDSNNNGTENLQVRNGSDEIVLQVDEDATFTLGTSTANDGSIVFLNDTNSFSTTLAVTDATADRTITLPDSSGEVLLDTVLTTRGDLLYRDASSTTRLPIGGASTCLRSDGTDAAWGSCSGTGDILQNGNSFGANVVIGSNDATYGLSFETENNIQATIAAGGATIFENSTDSTGAFIVRGNGDTTPILNVDTTNDRVGIGIALPTVELDVVGAGQFSGNLTVNGTGTFNSDVDLTLADTENLSITNTVTGTNAVDLISTALTNNTSSGTQRVGFLQNVAGTGVTEAILALDNADSDTAVTDGLVITSAAGTITDGIDVSDAEIDNAINIGANAIAGTNFSVSTAGAITAPTATDTINGLVINAGALSGVTGYTQTSGAFAFSGGGNFSVDSAGFDVTTAGAVSGVTTLTASGNINTTGGAFQLNGTDINTAGTLTNVAYENQANTFTLANIFQGNVTVENTGYLAVERATDFSTTGTTNDANLGAASLVRLTGASAQTVTGITGGADGRLLTVVNAAGQAATLSNEGGTSTAANRIVTGTGSDLSLPAGASITLIYDAGASRWRVTGGAAASGGPGINTLANIGSSPNADGASISGTTLTLQPADGSFGGVVTTAAQTFAGAKTFSGNVLASSNVGINNASAPNRLSVNSLAFADAAAQAAISTGGTTNKGLVVQGVASQSADLLEVQDSTGSELFGVNSSGRIFAAASIVSGNGTFRSSDGTGASNAVTFRSGNATVSGDTGSVTITSGNATSGDSGDVDIDVGTASGTAGTVTIGGTTATGVVLGRSGQTTTVQGAFQVNGASTLGSDSSDNLTVNATSTFNTDATFTLADTENIAVTSAVSGTNSVDVLSGIITNTSTSGTQRGLFLQNADSTGLTEALIALDNADTNQAVADGLLVTSAAGTITDGIDVSDAEIDNAINIGANAIAGTNFSVSAAGAITAPTATDTINGLVINSGALSGITGYTQTSGNFAFSGGGNFSVDSAAFDVTAAGAVSGVTTLTTSGNINTTGGVFQLNGTDINTAGTLTNVAYENQANTFTQNNIFQGNVTVENTGYLAVQSATDFSTTGTTDDANLGAASLVRLTGASTQTITGITGGANGRILTIVNAAGQAANLNNEAAGSTAANRIVTGTGGDLSLPAGASITLVYDSTASRWRVTGGAAATGGTGVNTLANIGSSPNADGASISGNTLTLQPASASFGGVVTTAAQTFAGAKTFNALITGSAGLTVTGADVNLNASSNFNTNINTGTSSGTVAIGNSASTTNILGATNINTTGTAATSIGNSGAVTTLTGSSILLNSATLQRTAAGTTTLDLVDGSDTTLALTNSGAGVANFTTDGALTVAGDATVNNNLLVDGSADEVQLVVQANASQTADILQVQTSGGANLLTVADNGSIDQFVRANPEHVGALADGTGGARLDQATGVVVVGDYAYVASQGSASNGDALEIIDISDPTTPVHIGLLADDGTNELQGAISVDVVGQYAYVVGRDDDGLEIIDVSDPTTPTSVGEIEDGAGGALLNEPVSVKVVGQYAYVVSRSSNALEIIDVSDPTNPTHAGSIDDSGSAQLTQARGLAIVGQYAYVTSEGDDALEIIDISDPTNPAHVGNLDDGVGGALLNNPRGIDVVGKYAYIAANSDNALEIVDISDPAAPAHAGSIVDGAGGAELLGAMDVEVIGDYAYVSAYTDDSIEVIDISDPTSPSYVSAIDDNGTTELNGPTRMAHVGNYLYVGGYDDDGFQIIDIGGATFTSLETGTLLAGAGQFAGNLRVDGTAYLRGAQIGQNGLLVSGNTGLSGDLAVNGGDLTTTATTFNLLGANATTVNAFGAATTIDIGAQDGLATIRSDELHLGWAGQATLTGNGTAGLVVRTDAQADPATSSGTLDLRSGNVTGTGASNSGNVSLGSGTSVNGASGTLTLNTGNVTGGTGNSGNLTIDTGTSAGGTTGTISIGTANASAISIGNGTGTFAIDSSAFDVTTAGAVSGVTTLTASGNINTTGGVFQLNGTDINTAGTLTNVAYENQANTFTLANIFQGNVTVENTGYLAVQSAADFSTTGTTNDANLGNASLVRLTGASTQTITGITGGVNGRILTIVNAASQAANINDEDSGSTAANRIVTGTGADISLLAGSSITLVYDSTSSRWRVTGSAAATGTGVTTLSAIGSSPNANGATITGNTLNLEPASASFGGVVTTAAQTFAGAKTFNALITGSAGLTVTGADVNLNASSNFNTNINTGTSNGTVAIGNSASTTNILGATNINTSGTAATSIGNSGAVTTLTGSSILLNSATLQRTAAGATALDLVDGSDTTLAIGNSGAGDANVTIDGDLDVAGTLTSGTGDAFQVSAAGAVTAVGVDSGTGLLEGTGGLTVTGTANINATGTSNTSIGNGTGTFEVNSSAFDVSTAGAVSGVTTLTASGNINTTAGVFQLNGTDINTAGTLTNVAYENQANTFTLANIFQGNVAVENTGYLAVQSAADFSTTGTTNNANLGAASLVRLTGASTQTITGITGGANGRILTIVNAASQAANLNDEDSGSTAANRIVTGTGGDLSLPAGASITLVYDSTASRWRVTSGAAASGGPGVNALANIGSSPNADGASISGTTLTLQPASSSFGGVVTTAAQNFAGVKTFDSAAVFDVGFSATLAGTENLAVTSDLAGTVDVFSLVATPSSTAGTTRGIFLQQANSANTNGLDSVIVIDNADADLPITTAIEILNSGGGGYTNILDSPNIDIAGTGDVTTAGDIAVNGGDITSTSGTLTINGGTKVRVDDELEVGTLLTINNDVTDGQLEISHSSGRIYFAPYDSDLGAFRYNAEFGYNPTTDNWYVEDGLDITSGDLDVDNNTTLGTDATDTLTVNATSTFNSDVDIIFGDTSGTAATESGLDVTVTDSGSISTGTDNTYGQHVQVTRTGTITGGTVGVRGSFIESTANVTGSINNTGLEVRTTGGTSATGLLATVYTDDGTVGASVTGANIVSEYEVSGGTNSVNGLIVGTTVTDGAPSTVHGIDLNIDVGGATGGTNLYGIHLQGISGAAATNVVGIVVEGASGGTNNTDLLLGTTTVPGGDYGIYNASTDANYFEGDLRIGDPADLTARLSVNGDADETQLLVQANATQTADLVVIEDSAGNDLIRVDDNGAIRQAVHADPKHVSNISGYDGRQVVVKGDYAYLVESSGNALRIIDVSDPTTPTLVSSVVDTGGTSFAAPLDIEVVGEYAYVPSFNEDALNIVDISDPTNPSIVGTITDDGTTELDGAHSVEVVGNYAYVTAGNDHGVEIVDISDPTNPVHVGAIDDTDDAGALLTAPRDIQISGDYAYVGSIGEEGFEVIDISDPTNPTHAGALADGGSVMLRDAYGIDIDGKYAYVVALGDDAVQVIDISDPANPAHVSNISDSGATTLDAPHYIKIAGDYAYVGAGGTDDGVSVLDISDPTSLSEVASVSGGSTLLDDTMGLTIDGNYLYVAVNGSNALQILDIGGATLTSANIGNLHVTDSYVDQSLVVGESIFTSGLNVGMAGLSVQGDASFDGVTSSKLTLETAATQNCTGSPCAITQSNIDNYGVVLITADANGYTVTLGDPTLGASATGRIIYITNIDTADDFVLSANGGAETINLKPNTTATMIWNGSDWTAAGASSSTDLQAAYDNTAASAGGAEIVLSSSGTGGLTVRNDATTPIVGGLLEIQSSIGSNVFSVNNNATEYASNGGAETAGASASTFPASTWDATTGGTITRYTTAGDNIATGEASVSVVTTSTNHGARNTLSTALTSGLTYTVSFAVRGAANFSTLEVLYSPDGTTSGTTSCASAQTVTSGQWTRISCNFVAGGSIDANNAILIRQTDATGRTFYIENLSVQINASATYAADGSVDLALGTNWTSFGTVDSIARETTIIFDTSGSVTADLPVAANRGIRNNLSIVPQTNTQYLVSFYARSDTTITDQLAAGFLPTGGTSVPSGSAACTDYNTQSLTADVWTKITCVFTTDGTTITDADVVIYHEGSADLNLYVDALTVTLNTNNSNNVQIGGGNIGGPVTLFTLDRSAGNPIADNNDAYLGSMYYDTVTGRIQCYEADGWGACGAAPDNVVNLNPEYAGAVLNGSGVGTMTADFCSNDTDLSVNSTLCGSGEAKNYYNWTSPQATQQTYSIYVTYQLPETFNGFASDDTVQLVARVDSTTNASVTYEMYRSTGADVSQCGTGETDVITGGGGSANVWYSYGINGNEATGCTLTSAAAGDFIIFKINMKANSNANAYVSTLSFTTTGR